jgi:hypothetical protein
MNAVLKNRARLKRRLAGKKSATHLGHHYPADHKLDIAPSGGSNTDYFVRQTIGDAHAYPHLGP